MMKKLNLIIVGLFLYSLSFSQTPVPGGTIVGQTWTHSGSPYIVDGDISVAMLTIEPGVTVLFSGNYKFEVSGILTAVGVPCDSIVFSQESGLGGWKGIKFINTAPGSEMAYCIIEKSKDHGFYIENSNPIIRNCLIRSNYYSKNRYAKGGGIRGIGDITLIDCQISGNTTYSHGTNGSQDSRGGGIYASGTLNLIRCIIKGNKANAGASWGTGKAYGGGIYVSGVLNLENCEIKSNASNGGGCSGGMSNGYGYGGGIYVTNNINFVNSIISNNTVSGYNGRTTGGVYCSNSGVSEIINTTVAYNSHQGIYVSGDSLSMRNSISYFNGGAEVSGKVKALYSNIQNGYPGVGNINYNPVFQGTSDLTIVNGSPCMNAGDPEDAHNDICFPPSLEGARNDMGAHGGPGACGWLSTPPDVFADFSSDPLSGVAPLTVQFSDLTTGDPSNWKWDFQNDGVIDSYDQNPEYTYNEPGIYTVLLRACDGENQDTKIKTNYITVYDKQTIPIPAGWSGISSYITPNDPEIENLFAPIVDNLVILQNYDGVYWPYAGVNTLGTWDEKSGYQIKLETEQQLTFIGWMKDNLSVDLTAGWNYLPVVNACETPAEELFSQISSNLQIVKEIAGGGVYWPEYGVNTLGELDPGKAYFVLVDADVVVEFPECTPSRNTTPSPALPLQGKGGESHSRPLNSMQEPNGSLCGGTPLSLRRGVGGEVNKTPITHTIAIPDAALSEIQPGTIICANDALGNCFGFSVWGTESIALTLFGDDPTTPEKDGFTDGEQIFFKLYNPKTKIESDLVIEYDLSLPDWDGTFEVNGLSAVKSVTFEATSINDAKLSDVRIYPNPVKDILHVDFGVESTVTLTILNIHGQVMLIRELTGQNNTLDISKITSGLHFVQLEMEGKLFCKKLVKE